MTPYTLLDEVSALSLSLVVATSVGLWLGLLSPFWACGILSMCDSVSSGESFDWISLSEAPLPDPRGCTSSKLALITPYYMTVWQYFCLPGDACPFWDFFTTLTRTITTSTSTVTSTRTAHAVPTAIIHTSPHSSSFSIHFQKNKVVTFYTGVMIYIHGALQHGLCRCNVPSSLVLSSHTSFVSSLSLYSDPTMHTCLPLSKSLCVRFLISRTETVTLTSCFLLI